MTVPMPGTTVPDPGIRASLATLPPALREEWDERAAILEFCAGYSRPEAERVALAMVRARRAR